MKKIGSSLFAVMALVSLMFSSAPASAGALADSEAFSAFMEEVANEIGGTVNLVWEVQTAEQAAGDRNPTLELWLSSVQLDCEPADEATAMTEVFLPLENLLRLDGTHRGRAQYDFVMALSREPAELCRGSLIKSANQEIKVQTLHLSRDQKLVLGLADHG